MDDPDPDPDCLSQIFINLSTKGHLISEQICEGIEKLRKSMSSFCSENKWPLISANNPCLGTWKMPDFLMNIKIETGLATLIFAILKMKNPIIFGKKGFKLTNVANTKVRKSQKQFSLVSIVPKTKEKIVIIYALASKWVKWKIKALYQNLISIKM